jgi:hypothetical protein
MGWIEIIFLIAIIFAIAIILAIVAITYTIIDGYNLTRERIINKLKIEELENTLLVYKQSRTSLQEVASKALLGEACLQGKGISLGGSDSKTSAPYGCGCSHDDNRRIPLL